jgi:membrane protein implicated in regulation of membrane protease activity
MIRAILSLLANLFSTWASEVAMLTWLAIAFVSALVEVSIPHFGFAFVGAGAVAAAVMAFFGFSLAMQIGTFVVVLVVSIVGLRSRLVGLMISGKGLPSRTDTLIGLLGQVTQDIDSTLGTGRVNVGGQDWAARSADAIPAGTGVKVAAADGIILEVTRA